MKKMKSSIYLLLVIFALFVFFGCEKKSQGIAEKEAIPVKVMKVKLQGLSETIDYVDNLQAEDEAMVYPKVSGKVIEKVKVDGNPVKKGEVIAYIDRDEVGFKFEKAPVESPLSGIIGRLYVDIGENVSTQTAIALVVDMDKMKIALDIPERYLPMISLGQQANVSVDAHPQREFLGWVNKISPVVDLDTRTAPIEIVLDNPEYLLQSGMFAKVKLVIREVKSAPVILKEAVMGKELDAYVFVIENGKAVLKKVSLGIRQGPYYEVKDGLKEGDKVVIVGQQRLYENAPVIAEENKE